MAIEFDRTIQEATFYSPLADFERVTEEVEVREDPLTGRQARVVSEGFLLPDDEPDIDEVVGDAEGCFFCPGMVEDATPEYPDFVGFDRGSRGEATSFPNLNPYGTHSNVVALTEDHYRPLEEFTPEVFADGLAAALEYVEKVFDHDPDADFASVNMNYLRPAGSSLIHPHLQTLVDDRATNRHRERVAAAREYHDREGSVYWADLAGAELDGPRYVGSTGAIDWFAPFAPRHHFHVQGIAETTGVLGPEDDAVADLAAGIANVLDEYADRGLNSFNFGLMMADDSACAPVIDIVGRSVFDRYYWSDATFFTVLHDETMVDVAPEAYADSVGEWF